MKSKLKKLMLFQVLAMLICFFAGVLSCCSENYVFAIIDFILVIVNVVMINKNLKIYRRY